MTQDQSAATQKKSLTIVRAKVTEYHQAGKLKSIKIWCLPSGSKMKYQVVFVDVNGEHYYLVHTRDLSKRREYSRDNVSQLMMNIAPDVPVEFM